jgi:type 2 lantibiotic, mersacidin/lichenicidin family
MSQPNDSVLAWKDRDYRDTLAGRSLSALPAHPAGDIDAGNEQLDLVVGGASTEYLLTLGCCQGVTSNCAGFTVQGPGQPCTVACITIWWTTSSVCNAT